MILLFRFIVPKNYLAIREKLAINFRHVSTTVIGEYLCSPFHSSIRSIRPSSLQLRWLFLQTRDTPNPDSLRILPGRSILMETRHSKIQKDSHKINNIYHTGFYVKREDKHKILLSPLAKELFISVNGIKAIFLGSDFITITKYTDAKWDHIRVEAFNTIMDFFNTGQPALIDKPLITDTTILDSDSDIIIKIKDILETKIRPSVMEDGGNIEFLSFDRQTGLIYVRLAGSCVGCPSASITLKNGVENLMKHYIPEIRGVTAIDEDDRKDNNPVNNNPNTNYTDSSGPQHKYLSYEIKLANAGIHYFEKKN